MHPVEVRRVLLAGARGYGRDSPWNTTFFGKTRSGKNYTSKEITVISKGCSIYKIINTDLENGTKKLVITTSDRNNNKTIFSIYSESENGRIQKKVMMSNDKNAIQTILNVSEVKVL